MNTFHIVSKEVSRVSNLITQLLDADQQYIQEVMNPKEPQKSLFSRTNEPYFDFEPHNEVDIDEVYRLGDSFITTMNREIEPKKLLFGGHFTQIKNVEFQEKEYYSNNLSPLQLMNELKNRHIILSGGVGTGKTTLIKDLVSTIYNQGNNVFYFCNRKKLRQQVEFDVNVVPLSYQYASYNRNQYQLLFNNDYDQDLVDFFGVDWLDNLDKSEPHATLLDDLSYRIENSGKDFYFIFDEIHYLVADATFNKQTNDIFEFMSRHQKRCHFILISASASYVWEFLSKGIDSGDKVHEAMSYSKFTDYYIPDNFDHIKNHYHYGRIGQLINIIRNTDGKVIVGSNNPKTWRILLKEFGDDVTFVQSEFEPEDEVARENWLTRQEIFVKPTAHNYHSSNKGDYFTSKVLCTTSALDNGVSIIDPQNAIKCVCCEFNSPMSIYQFIGRVRRQQGNGELANLNMFYKIPKEDDFFKHYDNLMGHGKVSQTPDKDEMNHMETQALGYDVKLKVKLSSQVRQKKLDLLEYNFKQMYLDTFYYKEVFRQPITIHNATQYLKDLGVEMKVQAMDEIKQARIELLDQVLGMKLNSKEFKALAEKLNFKRNRQVIKNPIDEIQDLGYTIIKKRINGYDYKIITK